MGVRKTTTEDPIAGQFILDIIGYSRLTLLSLDLGEINPHPVEIPNMLSSKYVEQSNACDIVEGNVSVFPVVLDVCIRIKPASKKLCDDL